MTPEKSPVGGAYGSEFQAFGGSHRAKLQSSSAWAVDMNPGQKNVNATILETPEVGSLTLVGPKFGGCGCQKTSV